MGCLPTKSSSVHNNDDFADVSAQPEPSGVQKTKNQRNDRRRSTNSKTNGSSVVSSSDVSQQPNGGAVGIGRSLDSMLSNNSINQKLRSKKMSFGGETTDTEGGTGGTSTPLDPAVANLPTFSLSSAVSSATKNNPLLPPSPSHPLTPPAFFMSHESRKNSVSASGHSDSVYSDVQHADSRDVLEETVRTEEDANPQVVQLQNIFNSNGSVEPKGESLSLLMAGKDSLEHAAPTTLELVRGVDADGNKMLNEYAVVAPIGQGSFGKVKLAFDNNSNAAVAIKVLNKERLERDHERRASLRSDDVDVPECKSPLELVQQEIDIMKACRHPNLVRLLNVIHDPSVTKLYMVMEYMEGGTFTKTPSLSTRPEWKSVDKDRVKHMFLDILHGLQYLHYRGVIHMDIKPENILITKDGVCKLADFGVCTVLSDNFTREASHRDVLRTRQGTPLFFAPEMLRGDVYFHGKATDVWALGVTFFIYVYGRLPFPGPTMAEYNKGVLESDPQFFTFGGDVPPSLIDVMKRMLEKEPALRITVPQLIGHPFFATSMSKVPIAWWVRCWKEDRIIHCTDLEKKGKLASTLKSNVEKTQTLDEDIVRRSSFFSQDELEN